MAVKEILLLGNSLLYKRSEEVEFTEINQLKSHITDLHDTLIDFRNRNHCGRAIAAPQIGLMKRLIYMYIEKPVAFINPTLEFTSDETFDVWDDCMSFPNLLVKVKRFKNCKIHFKDTNWDNQTMTLEGDLSELLQHEFDHLEGILAIQRAIDKYSFAIKGHAN